MLSHTCSKELKEASSEEKSSMMVNEDQSSAFAEMLFNTGLEYSTRQSKIQDLMSNPNTRLRLHPKSKISAYHCVIKSGAAETFSYLTCFAAFSNS